MTLSQANTVPELSVVILAHNEAANIVSLLDEVEAALAGVVAYEVVVVDDCSSDDMTDLLVHEAAKRPALRPLLHARQSGQSAGLITGVRAARGAWVATLDGDGQNVPADIPSLWARLMTAGDPDLKMIAGWRATRKDTSLKRLSSRIANRVRGGLLRDGTPDTGCGLKLFERALFLELPAFDHMHRFLPALARRAGAKVESVKVSHRPRGGGRSHYGLHNRLWVGIVDLIGVMWLMRRSRRPGGVEDLRKRTP
jgi:dolichol-phosphate mannosyltransferase